MEPDRKLITFVPGLEQKIRRLAEEMFGPTSKADSVEELLSTMLPDLIDNALAGDIDPGPGEVFDGAQARDQETELPSDIREAISSAEAATNRPNVALPVELATPPTAAEPAEDPEPPPFEFYEKSGRVSPDAILWAKGNPLKEQALRTTLQSLVPALWSIPRLVVLAERTYNMQGGGGGTDEEQAGTG